MRIGIIPGALGTQLLPRLINFEKSLSMCVGCDLVNAKDALKLGIVDQIITDVTRGKPRSVEKSKNAPIRYSDTTRNYADSKNADANNADGSNADGNSSDVICDPNSTDGFIERMVLVLENQIARGAMSPDPFRRTR